MSQTQKHVGEYGQSGNLLLDEIPAVVQLRTEQILGMNEARLLQQINYWMKQPIFEHKINVGVETRKFQGRIWVKIPPAMMRNRWYGRLRILSSSTIKRTVASLKKQGVLLTETFDSKDHNTNWYAIRFDVLGEYDGIYQSFLDQVEREIEEAKRDEDNILRYLSEDRQEEIWGDFERALDREMCLYGVGYKSRFMSEPDQRLVVGQNDPPLGSDIGPLPNDYAGDIDDGVEAPVPLVQIDPTPSSVCTEGSTDLEHLEGANRPNAEAIMVPLPYNTEQQQGSTSKHHTDAHEVGAIAPLDSTLLNVVNDLKSVAVVEVTEEVELPHSIVERDNSTVKELLSEGFLLGDAIAMVTHYGEARCLETLDDPKKLDQLLSELKSRSSKPAISSTTEPAPAAPSANTAPPTAAPRPAAPPVTFQLPPSEVEDRLLALAEMQDTAPNMDTRAAERLIEKHGPLICRYEASILDSYKPNDRAATLSWAIKSHQSRKASKSNVGSGHAPVEGSYQDAVAVAQGNAAAFAREAQSQKDAASEAARLDAQWHHLQEVTRTKIDQVVGKRLGSNFTIETAHSAWMATRRELHRAANNGQFNDIWRRECGDLQTAPNAEEKAG